MLDYCQTDVDALELLLPKMLPDINLGFALLRGRYMPTYGPLYEWKFSRQHQENRARLDLRRFWECVRGQGIDDWPTTPTGLPSMKQKTLEEMAARHPQMIVFQDIYDSIRSARIIGFKIDGDGRNRVGLRAFATKTGRNAPSGKEKKKKKQKKREDRGFIFSLAKWVRFLIAPKPDHALLYIDLEQAEFGIAAALSGDPAMMEAYRSADFYFTFARQAGEDVPAGATVEGLKEQFNGGEISRETYERLINLRKLYKIVVLATQYGLGISVEEAQNLLDVHRRTYRVFWDWIEDQLDLARPALAGIFV